MVNSAVSGILMNGSTIAATSAIKTMVNGDIIFTIHGDIEIYNLVSECQTANDATASTLQYQAVPTVGTATTISGASASLANAAAGTTLVLPGDAFATAPTIYANGPALAQTARGVYCPDGTIKVIMGVGSTTGTWRHYLLYYPLEPNAYVV